MLSAPDIDDAVFAEAEAALAALAAEYPAYAQADVDEMKRLADTIARNAAAGADMAADIEALYTVAHNVKGQGASFGYELMTLFGEAVCVRLRDQTTLAINDVSGMRSLVAACDTVLRERLTGTGGEAGEQLMATLGVQAP